MGDTTTTQNSSQHTEPWKATRPVLDSIVGGLKNINPGLSGNQSGALDSLVALARAGNPYAPAIDSYATTMLAGGGPDRTGLVRDAYNNYQANLQGTAAGDYLDPQKNPFFANTTNAIGNDVWNRVSGLYAGSGRDPAGAGNFGYNVSRGIAEGTAPVYGSIYSQERGNQLNAANSLYGAGNTTAGALSGLDQQRLANQGQGVGAAQAATNAAADPYTRILAAEAQRKGIPLSLLSQIQNIVQPMAQGFGTTTGTQSTTTPTNWGQLAVGAGMAGLGAMTGNPMMAAGGIAGLGGMFNSSGFANSSTLPPFTGLRTY